MSGHDHQDAATSTAWGPGPRSGKTLVESHMRKERSFQIDQVSGFAVIERCQDWPGWGPIDDAWMRRP